MTDGVQLIVTVDGSEVDESIAQERLRIPLLSMTILVEEFPIMGILIVIDAVSTTEYLRRVSLYIFYIGRGIQHIGVENLITNGLIAQTTVEVGFTDYTSSEVVAAKYVIADIREAIESHIGFRMSEDVSHTGTTERVKDASVVQVNDTVTCHGTHEAATIEELTFGHILRHVVGLGYTGDWTFQVHIGAVVRIVSVVFAIKYVVSCLCGLTFVFS